MFETNGFHLKRYELSSGKKRDVLYFRRTVTKTSFFFFFFEK